MATRPHWRLIGSCLVIGWQCSGCGLATHLAEVEQQYLTAPQPRTATGQAQSFNQNLEGAIALAVIALRDALFASQAGNRDATRNSLQSAQSLLKGVAGTNAPPEALDSLAQMLTAIQTSSKSANELASQIQSLIPQIQSPAGAPSAK